MLKKVLRDIIVTVLGGYFDNIGVNVIVEKINEANATATRKQVYRAATILGKSRDLVIYFEEDI